MKLNKLLTICLIFAFTTVVYSDIFSQERGNKNVIIEKRELPAFRGIDVGGSLNVFIRQGDTQSVKIETDENFPRHQHATLCFQ